MDHRLNHALCLCFTFDCLGTSSWSLYFSTTHIAFIFEILICRGRTTPSKLVNKPLPYDYLDSVFYNVGLTFPR